MSTQRRWLWWFVILRVDTDNTTQKYFWGVVCPLCLRRIKYFSFVQLFHWYLPVIICISYMVNPVLMTKPSNLNLRVHISNINCLTV